MKNTVFTINRRFVVDSERSEILDKASKQVNRLEPRLMKLLCLLIARQGTVLKRDYMIKEIWDDYPGANEGLNQAISFLRKLLSDENKTIIQTQPKSGYSFHAIISDRSEIPPIYKRKFVLVIIGGFLLTLPGFLIANIYPNIITNPVNREVNEKKEAETPGRNSVNQTGQQKK